MAVNAMAPPRSTHADMNVNIAVRRAVSRPTTTSAADPQRDSRHHKAVTQKAADSAARETSAPGWRIGRGAVASTRETLGVSSSRLALVAGGLAPAASFTNPLAVC